jgi:tetratricopeptide (TPR) repeat protein
MPKISLRAYNREIGNLIDRGQTDEAVAHCQYILQTYPKHLESYRLLGKAYLESHRYSEAIDIFQRVLAVVPDDFITHVGMSIIRNDENNLDAAVWHMERAFEVQPSNQAIQDELKKLYGRRDGQEPQKIRLTRGALCRMYARGNQTRQAIAEIKSILADEPERLDIEVLLARMYYQSNMTNEAVDLSRKILEKLPFCYDTNKLMVEILTNAKKVKETEPFKQKIVALDPYESLVNDPASSAEEVPEDAITVDKLYFDPSTRPSQRAAAPAQPAIQDADETAPDWLVSDLSGVEDLGSKGFTRILDSSVLPSEPIDTTSPASATQPVTTEAAAEEPLPSWLQDAEKEAGGTTAPEQGIPDFLKATGWAAAGSIDESTPPAQVFPMNEQPPEAEIAPGEIPDWLQTLAPAAAQDSAPAAKNDDFSDWLNKLDKTPDFGQTGILSEEKLSQVDEPSSQIPDWLQETARAAEPVAPAPTPRQAPIPPAPVPTPAPTPGPAPVPAKPVIPIQNMPPGFPQAEPYNQIPQPKATGSLKFAVDENFPIAGGTSILSPDDIPDWLQDLQPAGGAPDAPKTQAADIFAAPPPAASIPTPPAAKMEPPQDLTTTQLTPDEKQEIPDWLRDLGPIAAEPPMGMFPPEPEPQPDVMTMKLTPEIKQDLPDWLSDIQAETVEEAPTPEPTAVEQEDKRRTAVLPEENREEEEQMPDWLHLLEQDTPEAPAEEALPTIPGLPEDEYANPNLPDFAKFAEPAAVVPEEAPVDERPTTSILPPNPDEAAEELPEWLREIDTSSSTSPAPVEIPLPAADQGEFPDWLNSYPTPTPVEPPMPPAVPVPEPVASDEIPSWLQDINLAGAEQADSNLPDWLNEIQTTAVGESVPSIPQGKVDLPDWLQDTVAPVPAQAAESALPEMEVPVIPPVEIPAAPVIPEELVIPEIFPVIEEAPQAVMEEPIAPVEEAPVISSEQFMTIPMDLTAAAEPVAEVPAIVEPTADIPVEEMPAPEAEAPVLDVPAVEEVAVPEPVAEEPAVEIPVMEEAPVETADIPTAVEEVIPEAMEEAAAPAAEVPSWISEAEMEPQPVEEFTPKVDLGETNILKGTQALSLDETTGSTTFAVPADSILADESAAAAAAAIGIPLFAQGIVDHEEAPQAKVEAQEAEEQPVAEIVEPEETPAAAVSEPVAEEMPATAEEAAIPEPEIESIPAIEEEIPAPEATVQEVAAPIEEAVTPEQEAEEISSIIEELPAAEPEAVEVIPETVEATEEVAVPEAVEIAEEAAVAEPVIEIEEEAQPVVPEPAEAIAKETEVPVEDLVFEEPVAEEEVAPTPAPSVEAWIKEVLEEPVPTPAAIPAEPVRALDYDAIFSTAQMAVASGDFATAQDHFGQLIQAEVKLDQIISEVQSAIDQNPVDYSLWTVLGDAYGRNGNLQKALDAYTKAEEYLQ